MPALRLQSEYLCFSLFFPFSSLAFSLCARLVRELVSFPWPLSFHAGLGRRATCHKGPLVSARRCAAREGCRAAEFERAGRATRPKSALVYISPRVMRARPLRRAPPASSRLTDPDCAVRARWRVWRRPHGARVSCPPVSGAHRAVLGREMLCAQVSAVDAARGGGRSGGGWVTSRD